MENKDHMGTKGLAKLHQASRTVDGQTETRDFTQAEWIARDKSEGWIRDDGGDDLESAEEGEDATGEDSKDDL